MLLLTRVVGGMDEGTCIGGLGWDDYIKRKLRKADAIGLVYVKLMSALVPRRARI